MKDKDFVREIDNGEEHNDGSYVVKKSKKTNVLAFILCLLIAFVIWAYADATDKEKKEKQEAAQVLLQSEQVTAEESV